MPEKKRPAAVAKGRQRESADAEAKNNRTTAIIVIAVAAIAVLAYLSYLEFYSAPSSFQSFKSLFNSASEVSIYVNDTNVTTYQYVLGCTNALIQELTGPTPAHRNSTSIHLFVLYDNSTSCIYSGGRFGYSVNYSNATASQCLQMGASMPSIMLSYSRANSTRISGDRLYVSGDQQYMAHCGVAYQIT